MTKAELVRAIAEAGNLNITQAQRALDAWCKIITAELKNGGNVDIKGFGAFSVSIRAEREGRNPKTGEKLTIAERKVVRFKAGKPFKEAIA